MRLRKVPNQLALHEGVIRKVDPLQPNVSLNLFYVFLEVDFLSHTLIDLRQGAN